MNPTLDYSDEEVNVVKQTLKERYGEDVEVLLADAELRLDPGAQTLTTCPSLYWEAQQCHFVISKIGKQQYHAQFYYKGSQQFGTGIQTYDDLFNCVVTLLQVQADHELTKQDL